MNSKKELIKTPIRIIYDGLVATKKALQQVGENETDVLVITYLDSLIKSIEESAFPYEKVFMMNVFMDSPDYQIEGFQRYLDLNFEANPTA